jgi:L-malate glycosyltransferase
MTSATDQTSGGPVARLHGVRRKSRKLLLTIDQFWGPHGGTEQNLLFLCDQLPETGLETELVVLSHLDTGLASRIRIPVHAPAYSRSLWGVGFLKKARWLSEIIKREQADIVHAFCPVSEFAAVVATRWARRGTVVGSRRNVGYWHTFGTRWRARLVTRFVSRFVANCAAAKTAAVRQEWVSDEKVSVIFNPINLSRLNAKTTSEGMRQYPGVGDNELMVVIVATIRPVKDHETFLRAAQLVLREFPATRFLVIGDGSGEYLQRIKDLAATLGIDRQVTFSGTVANPFPVLACADVGVICSRSEGYSNALLEYAAAGLACVATDVGGLPEIIKDGETGYLVPVGDSGRLAERIMQLLGDATLRKSLGSNARSQALKRNDPKKIVQSYLAVYRQLLAKRAWQ